MRGDSARAFQLWTPVAAYMALIFYLSSLSSAPLPAHVTDTLAHACGYFILGALVTRGVGRGWPPRVALRGALLAIAITVGYGVTDEVHQMFVPGRTADIRDLAADATGAVLAVAGAWAWGIISRRPARIGLLPP